MNGGVEKICDCVTMIIDILKEVGFSLLLTFMLAHSNNRMFHHALLQIYINYPGKTDG